MKKCFYIVLCAAMILSVLFPTNSAIADSVVSPKAKILFEATTGQVIYSQNADQKLPMASVTKEMCLLLWAEDIDNGKLKLDDKIKASSYASSAEGSVYG